MAKKRSKTQRKRACKRSKTAKGLFRCWSKNTGARKSPSPKSQSSQSSLKHSPITNLTPGTVTKYINDANKWYDFGYTLNEQKTALEDKLYNTREKYNTFISNAKTMKKQLSNSSPKTNKRKTASAIKSLRKSKQLIPQIKLLEQNIERLNYLEKLNLNLGAKLHDLVKPNKRSTRRNIIKEIHKLKEQIESL